jgi:DNA-binding ferritin-like protein
MEEGAVTEDYGAQRHQVVRLFNDVLATEVVCVLRYKRHFFMAKGMNAESVNEEFVKHTNEEQQHAEWVVERITQLNGEPDFNPQRLTSRSESEYKKGDDLISVIKTGCGGRKNRSRILHGHRAMVGRRWPGRTASYSRHSEGRGGARGRYG